MPRPLKPSALQPGAAIRIVSPASPVEEDKLRKGCEEISKLGYVPLVDRSSVSACEGYFAGSAESRSSSLKEALVEHSSKAVFCSRGGYGSNYLLEGLAALRVSRPKILLGYSDITSMQIFLWQKLDWVTFYGPMVGAGFDAGAGSAGGYDAISLARATTETETGWSLELRGETLFAGEREGLLLGGCLTLIEATLGTPWALDTRNSILLLEDRAMKPYQVDRALIHLKQAGKFDGVRGVIFGDFPECEAASGNPTVRDVICRLFRSEGIPVAFGVPIGHSVRPILTIPLGVRGRLTAKGSARIEFLEPACVSPPRETVKGDKSSKSKFGKH